MRSADAVPRRRSAARPSSARREMSVATTRAARPLARERDRQAAAAGADVGDRAAARRDRGSSSSAASTISSVSGRGIRTAGVTSNVEAPELLRADDVGDRLARGAARDQRRRSAVGEVRRARRRCASVKKRAVVPAERRAARAAAASSSASASRDAGVAQPLRAPRRRDRDAIGSASSETAVASFSFSD